MNVKIIAVVVIFIDNFRLCQSTIYNNYSLYDVTPTNKEHLEFLTNLEHRKYVDIIFWKRPFKLFESVQLIVSPIDESLFLERAEHFQLRTRLLMKDVQSAFDDQSVRRYFRLRVNSFSWDTYHSLEDVYQWLTDLAVKFNKILTLNSIGKSTEGREIISVVVKKGHPKMKAIVEGGINGNEWISVEFVTYLLDQLLRSNSTGDKRIVYLLQKYEWHLIPVVNPDGYLYSQKTDRLWRKNRRALGGNNYGVDLNRNFDYNFGKYGTSDEETHPYYCGPRAFSEPESRALAEFVGANKNSIKFYFAFHGYGQKIVIPYADRIKLVDNFGEAENFARKAVYRINRVHKIKYEVENIYVPNLGLRYSGNSASYIKRKNNIRFVYIFNLRDNGTYGFALPSVQILPSCKEALTGIIELMTARPQKMKMHLFNGGQVQLRWNIFFNNLYSFKFCLYVLNWLLDSFLEKYFIGR